MGCIGRRRRRVAGGDLGFLVCQNHVCEGLSVEGVDGAIGGQVAVQVVAGGKLRLVVLTTYYCGSEGLDVGAVGCAVAVEVGTGYGCGVFPCVAIRKRRIIPICVSAE